MGLREKTDLNLQLVSLAAAILVILVLSAARHYTSDWRERRLFRRQLLQTQKRLQTASTVQEDTTEDLQPGAVPSLHTHAKGGHADDREYSNSSNNDGDKGDEAVSLNQLSEGSRGGIKDKANGSNQQQQRQRRRRRWKRFVAALPLMPLATAYIVARLGWDVFELLVFCAIDVAREMATSSMVLTRALITHTHLYGAELLAYLDIKHRLQRTVILMVEGTVVWLFNVAFPALANGARVCGGRAVQFAAWWRDTGGEMVRDAIEAAVLRGLVPFCQSAAATAVSVYSRTMWLCGRFVEAAWVLGRDIACDVRVLYEWFRVAKSVAQAAFRWMTSPERWWLDPVVVDAVTTCLAAARNRFQETYAYVVSQCIPRCASSLARILRTAYHDVLLRGFCWCVDAGDWAVQTVAGGLILGYGTLRHIYATSACLLVHVAGICARFCLPLARFAQLIQQRTRDFLMGARLLAMSGWRTLHIWVYKHSWIVMACIDAYSRARDTVLIPAIKALVDGSRLLWREIIRPCAVAVYFWAVNDVGPRVSALAAFLIAWIRGLLIWQRVSMLASVAWCRTMQLAQSIYRDLILSAAAGHLRSAMGDSVLLVRQQIASLLEALWPLMQRGWEDGSQAMADVYRQLVSLVDAAVAVVGDHVVEYAQKNTVHDATLSAPFSPAVESKEKRD
ncbi:hypothetical protein GGI07_005442 [Coemansia sp. Benny D115]|nr:hypothetical protein GGI07_005442 [Coemansia sp. Benny D115]